MPALPEPVSSPADDHPSNDLRTLPRGTASRRRTARESSRLARLGFALFVIGLLAVAVIMVLFATGSHDLPLWLNLLAMLAPVGFGIGLLGIFLEARGARPAR